MAIYRMDYTDKRTGWGMRLEIVPYDETLSGSVTTVSGQNVLEVGDQTYGYDEAMPIGIAGPASLKVKLLLSGLPSALQTYLRDVQDGDGRRNLWMLWSTRGTASYTLEYAGVQTDIEGEDYEVSPRSVHVPAEYELVDAVYYCLSATKGRAPWYQDVFGGSPGTAPAFNGYATYFGTFEDVASLSGARAGDLSDRAYDSVITENYRTSNWSNICETLRNYMTSVWTEAAARTANVSGAATDLAFDSASVFDEIATKAVTMYEAGSVPRTAGSALTASTMRLITLIYDADGAAVGGLGHESDELSFARDESVWDTLRDLAETFFVKLHYRIEYNSGSGTPYLSVRWRAARVVQSPGSLGAGEGVFDFNDMIGRAKIQRGRNAVGRAEVRTKTFADDVVEWAEVSGHTRSTRSWTTRMRLTNLPTRKGNRKRAADDATKADFFTRGLFQSNRIGFATSGTIVKAHEKTRVYYDASQYVEADSVESETPPTPLWSEGTEANVQEHWLWCDEVQTNSGLGYALAKASLAVFGSQDIATIEVEVPIKAYGANATADFLGYVWNMSGTPSSLGHIDFLRCVLTEVTIMWSQGKSRLKFVSVP